MNNFEYQKNYYNVPAELGRDVIVNKRKGTITEDMNNYIGVTFHDDPKKISYPCHPTSEIQYLDTFTDLKKFRPKNYKSKQRYIDYLKSDTDITFKEYLGIKNKI